MQEMSTVVHGFGMPAADFAGEHTSQKDDLPADFVLPFLRHTVLIGLGKLTLPRRQSQWSAFFFNQGL
jgi:hypothetical protein